jgi:hypothetical protein
MCFTPVIHGIGRWVSLINGSDTVEKRGACHHCQELKPDSSVIYSVALLLHQLSYLLSQIQADDEYVWWHKSIFGYLYLSEVQKPTLIWFIKCKKGKI